MPRFRLRWDEGAHTGLHDDLQLRQTPQGVYDARPLTLICTLSFRSRTAGEVMYEVLWIVSGY